MFLASRSLLLLTIVGAMFLAGTAEARFGKRSKSGDDSSRSDSSRDDDDDDDDQPSRGRHHEATAGDSGDGASAYRPRPIFRSRPRCIDYGCSSFVWTGYGYYPYYAAPAPDEAPQGVDPSRVEERPVVLTGGAELQLFRGGVTLGLNGLFEGKRWGFGLDYQGIAVVADDGSNVVDAIGLLGGEVSYALLASPHGRLRLLGGLTIASAPDVTFVGPRIGVSGGVALFGPVNAEGSLRITPFPHRQVEAFGGFALALGPLGVRVGYKQIYLDDRGLLDGERHADLFAGPYVGVALSL